MSDKRSRSPEPTPAPSDSESEKKVKPTIRSHAEAMAIINSAIWLGWREPFWDCPPDLGATVPVTVVPVHFESDTAWSFGRIELPAEHFSVLGIKPEDRTPVKMLSLLLGGIRDGDYSMRWMASCLLLLNGQEPSSHWRIRVKNDTQRKQLTEWMIAATVLLLQGRVVEDWGGPISQPTDLMYLSRFFYLRRCDVLEILDYVEAMTEDEWQNFSEIKIPTCADCGADMSDCECECGECGENESDCKCEDD